jgi:hypothetical protein
VSIDIFIIITVGIININIVIINNIDVCVTVIANVVTTIAIILFYWDTISVVANIIKGEVVYWCFVIVWYINVCVYVCIFLIYHVF